MSLLKELQANAVKSNVSASSTEECIVTSIRKIKTEGRVILDTNLGSFFVFSNCIVGDQSMIGKGINALISVVQKVNPEDGSKPFTNISQVRLLTEERFFELAGKNNVVVARN